MKLRLHSIFFLLGVSFLNVFAQPGARDKEVLDEILQRAKQTHSNSVLVIKDGKTVGEYYAGNKNEKIQLMSCTKSIVSLAIGKLIDDGKIKSLDQPVYEFYAEWKQGVSISTLTQNCTGCRIVIA